MYIDSHAHLFDDKIDIKTVNLSSIDKVLVPTYKMEHLSKALSLCKAKSKLYLAVGVYPEYVGAFDKKDFSLFVEKNIKDIFAIGEVGLDRKFPNLTLQREVLMFQLELAKKFNLPISVHLRGEVFSEFFTIMNSFNLRCALHCFSGSKSDLQEALARGWFISFATNLTYKRNVALRELATLVPDNQLLIETDSPSMAPSGFPRGSVNTSENIHFVAETLAKARGQTVEHVALVTSQNANNLFFKDML